MDYEKLMRAVNNEPGDWIKGNIKPTQHETTVYFTETDYESGHQAKRIMAVMPDFRSENFKISFGSIVEGSPVYDKEVTLSDTELAILLQFYATRNVAHLIHHTVEKEVEII